VCVPYQLRGRDVSLHESLQSRRRSGEHLAAELQENDARYALNNSMTDIISARFGER